VQRGFEQVKPFVEEGAGGLASADPSPYAMRPALPGRFSPRGNPPLTAARHKI
jgi:hypothetical protein